MDSGKLKMLFAGGATALLGIAAGYGLAGTQHSAPQAHPAATAVPAAQQAPSPAPAQFDARAVTVRGCEALAQWENDPSNTGTEGSIGTSLQVQQIIQQASGTPFGTDLAQWQADVSSGDWQTGELDAAQVNADCEAIGMPSVTGN